MTRLLGFRRATIIGDAPSVHQELDRIRFETFVGCKRRWGVLDAQNNDDRKTATSPIE